MKGLIYMLYAGLLFVGTIGSCRKTEVGTMDKSDKQAPGPVSNAQVENLNGAAKITYSLPQDDDLLYIRAEYTTKQGIVRNTKVSRYLDSVVLQGFADTDVYEARLYAVDKSENVSVPLLVKVQPKTPPFELVKQKLVASAAFGGLDVGYQNVTESNVAIVILANDKLGNFAPLKTLNTKLKTGTFGARNLAAVETRFGLMVRDRWGNLSDTTYVTLKPFFEAQLDRTKMKGLNINGTDAKNYPGNEVEYLFDGDVSNKTAYHTIDPVSMPQWFTFDMGQTAKLSRLVWFMRQGWYFHLHNPRKVEIWGSNNPSPDGSFTNWILLAEHEQIKPSGLPPGQNSNADIEAALEGETISIPVDAPAVRYIRFKTLRNWSDGVYVNFTELALWGNPQ
ncbi:F5/8 type C domain protein [compost metagenome]